MSPKGAEISDFDGIFAPKSHCKHLSQLHFLGQVGVLIALDSRHFSTFCHRQVVDMDNIYRMAVAHSPLCVVVVRY